MYTIYVVFKCADGKREEYVSKLGSEGLLSEIRNEKGCKKYDFYFSEKDPSELLLVEAWESIEDQQVHIKAPHMARFFEINKEYIESSKLGEFKIVE